MDIYTILSSKPHNVHYLNRYVKFMNSLITQIFEKNEYTEKHHICPKAKDMFPEYKSLKCHPWNKINLTPRQHYIAHWILWKTFSDVKSQRETFWLMSNMSNKNKNSKTYEKLKLEKSIQTSQIHSNKKVSNKTKEKLSLYRKGKTYEELYGVELAEKLKIKFKEDRKGTHKGDKNPMFGKIGSEHPNFGKPINSGIDNYMFGRTHTPESRLKISEEKKKRHQQKLNLLSKLTQDQIDKIVEDYLLVFNLKTISLKYLIDQVDLIKLIKLKGYYLSGRKIDEFRKKL